MVRLLLLLLLLSLYAVVVICMPPPHPDFEDEYRNKRRRLQGMQNYTAPPKLKKLSPELCHGLSDHDCRRLDDSYVDYTSKTRSFIASTGTVRTLVLCMRFTDHIGRALPTREDISLLWNAKEGEALDLLPTGSIREYLRKNSYDKMLLEADVFDWTLTDGTEEFYSYHEFGQPRDMVRSLYPVLQAIDALGTDFSKYDQDGDGVIDSLVLLHSGFAAELFGKDCYTQRAHEERIWSHAVGAFANDWTSFDNKYTLGGYMIASALRGICGDDLARIGVMTHEFIHSWGIPDLYDTSRSRIGNGVGSFDIMSNPYGVNGQQTHPSNMGPWSKIESGWLEPIEITQDGEYFIEASALSPNVYVIRDKFPEDEYILIENRQPIGWDEHLWDGGILIWHIDDNADGNGKRGYPGQYRWPGNGNHYRVAVSAADRNYDLEKGNNQGDKFDFWVAGSELTQGQFEFEATDFSQYPNTNSYRSGSIFPTGIRIYDISMSGNVMSFKVQGLSPAGPPTPNPSWSQDYPTASPTSFVPVTYDPVFCFSGDTTVITEDRGETLMKDLQLGDRVATSANSFESVYSFGHRRDSLEAIFIQLLPSMLEISADHMVFIQGGHAVPASSLQVGDQLFSTDIVTSIHYVTRTGVYAPFTPSGFLLVNNVKVSSYVAFQESEFLKIGDAKTPFTHHWLAHTFQTPHRLWCSITSCSKETYTDAGVSTWVDLPLQFANWWHHQDTVIMVLVLLPLALTFVAMSCLDLFIITYPLTAAIGLLGLWFLRKPAVNVKIAS
jgi:M6 family metalloprotease-like protein